MNANELYENIDITPKMVESLLNDFLLPFKEEDGYTFSYDVEVLTKRLNNGDSNIVDRIKGTDGETSFQDHYLYDDVEQELILEFMRLIAEKTKRLNDWIKQRDLENSNNQYYSTLF